MSSRFRPLATRSNRRPTVFGPFTSAAQRRAAERAARDAAAARQLAATLKGVAA